MPANILSNNYQQQNIFLKNQVFVTGTFNNATGSAVTLSAGMLLGRNLSTGYLGIQASGNTDGTEMPRGICADAYTVPANSTLQIQMCIKGDINQNALILNGSDTLSTVVRTVSTGGGTIGDLLTANTEIILYPSTEISGYDN